MVYDIMNDKKYGSRQNINNLIVDSGNDEFVNLEDSEYKRIQLENFINQEKINQQNKIFSKSNQNSEENYKNLIGGSDKSKHSTNYNRKIIDSDTSSNSSNSYEKNNKDENLKKINSINSTNTSNTTNQDTTSTLLSRAEIKSKELEEIINNMDSDELNKNINLSYSKDSGGVYTDSAEFTHLIPECTNVSVGYYKEHTTNEHQDIEHLINLAEACVLVDWENLPTKRNPDVTEYKEYTSTFGGYNWNGRGGTSNWRNRDYGYHDDWYDDDDDPYGHTISETLPNRGKKNKRGKRGGRGGKTYYDNGSELLQIDSVLNSDSKYDWIFSKFTDTGLEYWELQIVKDQYLDMNNSYDKFFYDYLLEKMYENNV